MQVAGHMPCLNSNRVCVDLDALEKNLQALKECLASPSTGIMAVVKSDAYGHGLLEVSRALESLGVWGLGISEIEEAFALREAGVSLPIVLLSGICPGTEDDVVHLNLITGVPDLHTLNMLERAASRADRHIQVHIKVDTGMGRFGLTADELEMVSRSLASWPHLKFSGLYSHLSAADDPEDLFTQEQIKRFRAMLDTIRSAGWNPRFIHLANSAGLIHFPETHFNLVRPGIALYGSYPGRSSEDSVSLQPVMSFKSRIISIRDVPAGYPVSYGHTWHTERASRIAVIPVGYDDGYLRSLSSKARVIIRGKLCPVIGRICMKAMMVDVTGVDNLYMGDEVILLGSQEGMSVRAEELAGWADTISYELLCLLGTRNRRYFKRGG